jgi:hypothetical protein
MVLFPLRNTCVQKLPIRDPAMVIVGGRCFLLPLCKPALFRLDPFEGARRGLQMDTLESLLTANGLQSSSQTIPSMDALYGLGVLKRETQL